MDIKDLKIIDKEVSYSKMIDFVMYVVAKSFGENDGRYHAYLRDYYEMISLLTMYTNYDGDYNIDEVMVIKASSEWISIEAELGYKYYTFHNYIDSELNRINAPFAKFDDVLSLLSQFLVNVNAFIEYVSKDDNAKQLFESFDVNKFADILNTYTSLVEKKDVVEKKDNNKNVNETVMAQHS